MNEYILFLYDCPADFADTTPEQMQGIIEEYSAWAQKLGAEGKHLGGQKLADEGGRILNCASGDVTVTDGPYSEAKEVIGGFMKILAPSYDEAVAIARTCPHARYGARIEVRQVDLIHEGESAADAS